MEKNRNTGQMNLKQLLPQSHNPNEIAQAGKKVGRAETRSFLGREVWGSNLWPVKLNTVLQTVRHRCDISSKEAVLPRRNNAEMGPTNSLHVSAYYSE